MLHFFKNQISKCFEEKSWFFTAIFYAFVIVNFRVSHFNFDISDFSKHSFSQATASNFDISARVWLYFSSVFLFLILSFSFKYLLSFSQKFIQKNISKIINYTSIIGLFFIMFQALGFEIQNSLIFIFYIHILVAISGFLFHIFKFKPDDFHFVNFFFSIIIFSISFSIPIIQFINFDNSFSINFFLIFAVLFLLFETLELYFFKKLHFTEKQIIKIFSPLAFLPILYVFSVEFYLILNNYEFFLISPTIIYSIVFTAILALVSSNFIHLKQNDKTNFKLTFSNFVIPSFIAGMVAMIYYEPILKQNTELFELANPFLSVQQYFEFGKIPFIDNFNSHALSEIFFKFIFSITNTYDGLVYTHYDFIEKVIYSIIVYFVLRSILNNSTVSLCIVMFLPFLESFFPLYFNITLLAILSLIFALKKQNFISYLLLIISIVFLVVWRIDIGFAVLISAIYSTLIFIFIDKNILKTWKIFLKAFGFVFGVIALKFLGLYFFTDGNILHSLSNILNYLSSAQSYGIPQLTYKIKDLTFNLHFVVFPAVALVLLILSFVTFKKNSEDNKNYKYFFVSFNFLIVFYLMNFQRGIIRHSFIENWDTALSSYIFVVLASSFLLFFNQLNSLKKSIIFVSISSIILFGFKYPQDNIFNKNYFERFIEKTEKVPFIVAQNTKIERIIKVENFEKNTYSDFKNFLDENFSQNETFADFSNTPMLYYYTHRENPNFFNQSLLTCHNDKLQELYINEISQKEVPVVVFSNYPLNWWDETDGISNTLRFYKISNYLFKNYKPYAIINNRTIWLKNNHQLFNQVDTILNINKLALNLDDKITKNGNKTELNLNQISIKNNENPIFIFVKLKTKNNSSLTLNLNDNTNLNYVQIDTISNQNHYVVDASIFKKTRNIEIQENVKNILEINIIQSKYFPDFYSGTNNKTYDLKYIPYIFGKYDSKTIDEKFTEIYSFTNSNFSIQTNNSTSFEIPSIDKFSNYILVQAKSNSEFDNEMLIDFSNIDSTLLGAFKFVVKSGDFENYIIPISTNFNWTNKNSKFLNLQSINAQFEIEKVSIIKEKQQ